MITWMENVFLNELTKLLELLSLKETEKPGRLKKIVHYTTTVAFLAVCLAILVKGTFALRHWMLEDLLANEPVIKGIAGGLFKTTIIVVFILIAYMFVIRMLLLLKKYIELSELSAIIGVFMLLMNMTKALAGADDNEFWNFSAGFVAKTLGFD